MPNAGGDVIYFVVTHIQKGEAPQLAEGFRQLSEAVVGKVEALQPLECPHLCRQRAQAVVAQSEPHQAAQRANFSRDFLQVVGVHIEAGEVPQMADLLGKQLHPVPQAALSFWAHLQHLQLLQAKDLCGNWQQLSARDLELLLPFIFWIVLCEIPPEWIRTWTGTSRRGDCIHIPAEQWLVEQRLSVTIACSTGNLWGFWWIKVLCQLCALLGRLPTHRVFELLRYIPLSKHLVFSHDQVFSLLLCRAHKPSS